jgi:hypothetical protein
MLQTEPSGQNQPAYSGFAENKDSHGRELSESLISVPVIDGAQLEMTIKPPCPHTSPTICAYALYFQTPIGYKMIFFARRIILLLLPFVLTFLPPLPFSLLHDVKRTNERTNGNSSLLTSCSSFAYHY